jgi:predicted nucleic acid-binding protein
MRYFDASALAKRYVRENGSAAVRRLLASGVAATSRLSEVEVASAIARRAREGAMSVDQRDRLLAALGEDVPALAIVELVPAVVADARSLLSRQVLRAADSVQLASALYLQREVARPVEFVVFDERLARAARAEGLTVVGVPRRASQPTAAGAPRPVERAGVDNPPVPGGELPGSAARRRRVRRR